MNIARSPETDIFSIFVFNNIARPSFIFPPRVFSSRPSNKVLNLLNFNNLTLYAESREMSITTFIIINIAREHHVFFWSRRTRSEP